MNELFLKIINMSISASWLILAVLILRLVLKKAPKWVNVLLWGIVAVSSAAGFPIFHRERIESNSKCRNHSAEHWNEYHPYHQ